MSIDRRSFLMAGSALVAGAGLGRAAEAKKYWVFLGCYTGGKGGSKGIGRCSFDPATGKLGEPETAAETGSPSFVTVSADNKFLYSVGENGAKGFKGGRVRAYALNAATGNLSFLSEGDSIGSGPCHVSVDPTGRLLFVANYGGGSSTAFALTPDGGIAKSIGFHQYKGGSVDKSRQSAPHTHCTAFTNDGKHCFVVDLGLDAVLVHAVDPAAGTVSAEARAIPLPKGSGPRHIAFNADESIAYVNGELDMTVNVVTIDRKGQKYEVIQTLSTVPEGKPMKGYSTAEVKIHPNGKFVYVSNRGQDSVGAFAVRDGGKLKPIGYITGDIKTPRNFNIDPSGRWMLIANQDGHTVQVYRMQDDGLAKPTDSIVKYGSPVCVKFAPMG